MPDTFPRPHRPGQSTGLRVPAVELAFSACRP
jgi:hypothetical protein